MENTNKDILTPVDFLIQKINKADIKLHLDRAQMKAILNSQKYIQKMSGHYGTTRLIDFENKEASTTIGYGTHVVSVNEENAKQFGINLAAKKYGNSFYINNKPLTSFLKEKGFSEYWISKLNQYPYTSVNQLSDDILTTNVKGNNILQQELKSFTTLFSLDLIEMKRDQVFVYSVDIPNNNNDNYLFYNKTIGFEHANKINDKLKELGTDWKVTRNNTGKDVYFNVLTKNIFNGNQTQASQFLKSIGYVGMEMDSANYIIFDDKDMNFNKKIQFMKNEKEEIYGFVFENEIYLDEELINSNTIAHEYTHLWDKYIQNTNPDLWEKGKDVFSKTHLWEDVKNDPNYADIANDDDLVLSECHARICGEIAEKVLESIAIRDGGITKESVINWDKEVSDYINTLLLSNSTYSESNNSENIKSFLMMPMKDLINEVAISNNTFTLNATDIYPILNEFSKLPPDNWDLSPEAKVSVYHLLNISNIKNENKENTINNLENYFLSEEYKKEEKELLTLLSPIIKSFKDENNSVKYFKDFSHESLSSTETNISTNVNIKSILGNTFTGNNENLVQNFRKELLEAGKINSNEEVLLINEIEANAKGTKIKSNQPFVILNIPVKNNDKTEFIPTKYYHISSTEKPELLVNNENLTNTNDSIKNTNKNVIVFGKTKIPEFAMFTQHGLTNFTDMIIDSFEESTDTYLLKSEDKKKEIRITKNTLEELTTDYYQKKSNEYTDKTKTIDKITIAQYKDFSEIRTNNANNFKHNLSVYCRKEANSPLDAIKLASSILNQMSESEKEKTKKLLSLYKKKDQCINEVIVTMYNEAVKQTPLNESYIKLNFNSEYRSRPIYDTLSNKGEIIDKNFDLKIGDTIDNIAFKTKKIIGFGKNTIYENCTIVSASKEANRITLMNKDKSFYDVSRDTFLKNYAKFQQKENKLKHHNNKLRMEIER